MVRVFAGNLLTIVEESTRREGSRPKMVRQISRPKSRHETTREKKNGLNWQECLYYCILLHLIA